MARFKHRTVSIELHDWKWIRNLSDINTSAQLEEFVILHMAISTITLTDQRDKIIWRWTTNGRYSVASTYKCQFIGATIPFPAREIWKADAEPKCRFFASG
jgi:hypothetical protein